MTAIVGLQGEYLWSDGTTSSLAPPSRSPEDVLAQPTQFIVGGAQDGVAVNYDRIYETQPLVAAAVNLLAGQVARLPLKAFTSSLVTPTDDIDDLGVAKEPYTRRERDRTSALARALRRPSPRRSSFHMKWDIAQDLKINGNHLERITWAGGEMHLSPIPWRYAQPVMSDANDQIYGWRISKPGEDDELLGNLDVLHFARGTTLSGLGISPLAQLQVTVHLEVAAKAFQISSMRNQARMGVIVEVDAATYKDAEVRESIRQEFSARYAGANNAGRPYVATGVGVHTVPQQTIVDADLVNQRVISREEIAAIFGMATLFLGDSSKATQNNVEEMHKQLYKTTLAVDLELICATFDAQLIQEHPRASVQATGTDSYVEFDASAILSGDPLQRSRSYQLLQSVGGITINEIRDRENLPRFPFDWADQPMLPVNNVAPAEEAFRNQPEDAENPGGAPEDAPEDPDDGE